MLLRDIALLEYANGTDQAMTERAVVDLRPWWSKCGIPLSYEGET